MFVRSLTLVVLKFSDPAKLLKNLLIFKIQCKFLRTVNTSVYLAFCKSSGKIYFTLKFNCFNASIRDAIYSLDKYSGCFAVGMQYTIVRGIK